MIILILTGIKLDNASNLNVVLSNLVGHNKLIYIKRNLLLVCIHVILIIILIKTIIHALNVTLFVSIVKTQLLFVLNANQGPIFKIIVVSLPANLNLRIITIINAKAHALPDMQLLTKL